MAIRASMSDLIARVRLLVGDPVSASQQFSDGQVQDALDHYREDVRYLALRDAPTLQTAPLNTVWLDYYDDGRGAWESDATLYKYDFSVISPATSDYLTGHWTFLATQLPPVFIIGKSYDVYAASADLLEMWAAILARAYAFSADGATFNRNQQTAALQQMAALYRRQARPRTARMVRDDVNLAGDHARRGTLSVFEE